MTLSFVNISDSPISVSVKREIFSDPLKIRGNRNRTIMISRH